MRARIVQAIGRASSAMLAGALVVGLLPATAGAASVTIAAAGDIARRNAPGTPQQQTAALITDVIQPSRVLVLGDEQYEHGEYAQFLASYDPTWGDFKNISAPVPGNHEYETTDAAGYFQYFDSVLRGYGTTATDHTRGYYSFNLGDWHIVAINSNCSHVSCSAQRSWLRSDLAADDHLCELVFYHHAKNQGLSNAVAASGGDVILGGHKHTYERWDSSFGKNVRRFIVGTGGKSVTTPDPAANAGVQAFGVLELVLNPSGYSWSFVDVNRRVRDSGTGTCHA
jgi:hypothetical protein